MAHKGKKYKLQFRRDLTLRDFQTKGFAECYNGRTIIFREAPPGNITDQVIQYINLDKSGDNNRQWIGQPFTFLGANARIRWTMRDAWKFPDVIYEVVLERLGGAALLRKAAATASNFNDYTFGTILMTQPWDFQSVTLPGTWDRIELDLRAAGYDTYNP